MASNRYYDASWLFSYMGQSSFTEEVACRRMERLEEIWRVATGTWTDYLNKPAKCDRRVWDSVVERFACTDLQTPVLTTLTSAAYGGKVVRRIKRAHNKEDLEKAIKECNLDLFMQERAAPLSLNYGTSYVSPGWRNGSFKLVSLPSIPTAIDTPEDDVDAVNAIISHFPNQRKRYTSHGIYIAGHGVQEYALPDSNYGFVPVAIFRGTNDDPGSPYGGDLVYPATRNGMQCTYLENDIMVLERLQSYSTLVIKGQEAQAPDNKSGGGPFAVIRLQAGPENDAFYISPAALITEVNTLITSKYERTAVQCQVPVEIFTRAKAGTNQAAGSSYLTHKPLYDLIVSIQERKRREEFELLAIMDAQISFVKNGKKPVNLEKHRKHLDVEISFERESNPSLNQSDVQTIIQAMDANLMAHDKGYYIINPDGNDDEQRKLEALRQSARTLELSPKAKDGFYSDAGESSVSDAGRSSGK